jgi:hypothetical protein
MNDTSDIQNPSSETVPAFSSQNIIPSAGKLKELCVQQDLQYGDFGFHDMLQIESSSVLMMTS